MSKGIENILKVYDLADEIDRAEGFLAYRRYRMVCQSVADRYSVRLPIVVAVFAATSPNNDYKGNLRSTLSILDGWDNGRDFEQIQIATYRHCGERAFSYLRDGVDFLATTKGDKIRSFYRNIMEPENPEFVTIDGHAVNVWRGELAVLKSVVRSKWKYETVADDYRAAARQVGILPNQLQATTWFCWKRLHNILYTSPQQNLFFDRSGDFWQTLETLDGLKPFAPKQSKIESTGDGAARAAQPSLFN